MNFEPGSTFTRSHVLEYAERDPESERLALQLINRQAPDLVGMIMGHLL